MSTALPDLTTAIERIDELSLTERLRMVALSKAMLDAAKAQYDQFRALADDAAIKAYEDSDRSNKQFAINLPNDGPKVATFSITEGADVIKVADQDAFEEWVEENHNDRLTIKTVVQVDPEWQKSFLEHSVTIVDVDGEKVAMTVDGEILPGVKFVPAPKPSGGSLRYETVKKSGTLTELTRLPGKERILAWVAEHNAAALIAAKPEAEPDVVVVEPSESAEPSGDAVGE